MTEFLLCVNTLSGTKVSLPVRTDTLISKVCKQLEEKLSAPWLHEFRICVGEQELSVGSIADAGLSKESSVQALVAPSATKAIQLMEDATDDCVFSGGHSYVRDEGLFSQAATVLGQSAGLTEQQGLSFLLCVTKHQINFVTLQVGRAYGRCCNNPGIHVPSLLKTVLNPGSNYRSNLHTQAAALIAFAEMELNENMFSEAMVLGMIQCASNINFEYIGEEAQTEAVTAACGLAGRFGGKTVIPALEKLQHEHVSTAEVAAAAAAVADILARDQLVACAP